MVAGRILIIYAIGLIYLVECRRDIHYNGDIAVRTPAVEPPAVWETDSEDWNSQSSSFSVPQYWTQLYDQYWGNAAQSLHYPSMSPINPWNRYRNNLIKTNYSFGKDENGHYVYIPGKTLDLKRKPNFPWNYAPGMWTAGKNKYDLRNFYLSLRRYPFYKQLASLRKYKKVIRS